jgi:hypothetical protein
MLCFGEHPPKKKKNVKLGVCKLIFYLVREKNSLFWGAPNHEFFFLVVDKYVSLGICKLFTLFSRTITWENNLFHLLTNRYLKIDFLIYKKRTSLYRVTTDHADPWLTWWVAQVSPSQIQPWLSSFFTRPRL